MSTSANRWSIAAACLLASLLCPIAMTWIAMRCDSGRHPDPAEIYLPSLSLDGLLWSAVVLNIGFLWAMPRQRWIGVLVSASVIVAAAVSWTFNGLWIEGQYF